MADVLSQSQIDALLSSMQNTEENRTVDFTSHNQRKSIENMTFTVPKNIQKIS